MNKIGCDQRISGVWPVKRALTWPNAQTACTATCIISNVACWVLKVSSPLTFGLDLPSRVTNIVMHRESYGETALNIVALVAPLMPYGKLVSIAIDTVLEVLNYKKMDAGVFEEEITFQVDPSVLEDAYRILNIQDRSMEISEVVAVKEQLIAEFQRRKLKASLPLVPIFEKWIRDAEKSCKTICDSKSS